jgi:hypothetical protein
VWVPLSTIPIFSKFPFPLILPLTHFPLTPADHTCRSNTTNVPFGRGNATIVVPLPENMTGNLTLVAEVPTLVGVSFPNELDVEIQADGDDDH